MGESQNCKYHPDIRARWTCVDCGIDFCMDCVSTDYTRHKARCPVCKSEVEPIAAKNFILPFWRRLDKLLAYPLQMSPAVFIVIVALIWSFLPSLLRIVDGICLLILYKYSFVILERTAWGRREAPDIDMDIFVNRFWLPAKFFIIIILMGLAIFYTYRYLGMGGAVALGLLFLLGLPAMLMVLATEEDVIRALNPAVYLSVIRAIGPAYLLMYGFLLLIFAVSQLGQIVLFLHLPGFLGEPLGYMTSMYGMVLSFHLMGYVVYQYHDELGFNVSRTIDTRPQTFDDGNVQRTDMAINEIKILIAEGREEEAMTRLRAKVAQDGRNLPLHELYRKTLLDKHQIEEYLVHAREYINILLVENKWKEAARVFEDTFKLDNSFRPSDPGKFYLLARVLRESRSFKAVVGLINGFHKQHANHPDLPKLYLLAAQVLNEELNAGKQAEQILAFLERNFGQHEMIGEIQANLQAVRAMLPQ